MREQSPQPKSGLFGPQISVFNNKITCKALIFVCSLMLGLFFSVAVILETTCVLAAAGETAPVEVQLTATLDRISTAAAGVKTISSRMVQEKHLAAFREVIKTSGRFTFQRPDCWSWELTQPVVSGIMVCGGRGRSWHENGGASQLFKLADKPWLQHFATQVTAWTTADFTFLKEQYDITLINQNPPILNLVPKEPAARQLIAALEITFAADCSYVARIVIRESGRDYTSINFLAVTINKPIPDDFFK